MALCGTAALRMQSEPEGGSLPCRAAHFVKLPRPLGDRGEALAGSPVGGCLLGFGSFHAQPFPNQWMFQLKKNKNKKNSIVRLAACAFAACPLLHCQLLTPSNVHNRPPHHQYGFVLGALQPIGRSINDVVRWWLFSSYDGEAHTTHNR